MIGGASLFAKLKHLRKEKDGRIYVRRNGRSVRIAAAPGTDDFLTEYGKALEALGRPKPETPGRRNKESFAWLVLRYYHSAPSYKHAATSTREARRRILDAVAAKHGHKLYADLEPRHVQDLLDEVDGGPEAKNSRLKALRSLYDFALAEKLPGVRTNPAKAVAKCKVKSDGFYTATADDVAQFERRHGPGSKARLALRLILYAGGTRRQDLVRLGRQMQHGGRLTYRTGKGDGEIVSMGIAPELAEELAHVPRDQLTFLVTDYGRPFSVKGFGNRFRKWCDDAGLADCSCHSFRKGAASIAAEKGASEAQLRAMFGWAENSNEPRRYTRAARRKVLADEGMKLLTGNRERLETVPVARTGTKRGKK